MPVIPPADLALLRTEPSRSKLYCVIQQPVRYDPTPGAGFNVDDYEWYGRVAVAPISDPVVSLSVTANAAAPAATVYDGMTILFSSLGYGLWDKGIAKVHGDQTLLGAGAADTLYVHVSSDMAVISYLDFITILDEHRFWTRYPKVEGPAAALVWYKDYGYYETHIGTAPANLAYKWSQLGANDAARRQASMPPVPIMGPHAVQFIDPSVGSVNINFDWSQCYTTAPGGGAITWGGAPGATSTAYWIKAHGTAPVASTAQVPGAVNYTNISGLRGFRVGINLMVSGGNHPIEEFRRGVRYVFTLRRPGEKQVGDPDDCYPITDFELQDCGGSFDSGGWRARIRIFGSQAHEYYIRPGSLVIVFADDWYGNTHTSIAPDNDLYTDRENIVMCGYIADGSIEQDSETGDVTFDVLSLTELMKSRENYPVPIENNDAATTWYQTPDLTIDRACHHYLTWHTNLKQVADVFQTGDTREIAAMDFLAGDCYSTIDTFLNDRIFARLLCNRFGQIKMDIDRDMEVAASGAIHFTYVEGDALEEFTADEVTETPVSIVDLGGVLWNNGVATPMLSHAPGAVSKYWGNPESSMSLAIASQTQLNALAGRLLAYKNNRFPRITMRFGNWRVFDIWPQDYIYFPFLTPKETERHNFHGRIIPREISYEYDATAGAILTSITAQAETDGPAGLTITIPDEVPPPPPPPRIPPPGPGPGPVPEDSGRRIMSTGVGVLVTDNIGSSYPHWYLVNDGVTTGRERCWKIIRDPWHWWTSGGTERTLWGIFSNAAGEPYYIYKMENFPYGTWTQIYAASSVPGAVHPWIADIVGSIEREGYFYALVDRGNGFNFSGEMYCAKTINGGASWTHPGVVYSSAFPPEWSTGAAPPPIRRASIDLGQHSAATMAYAAVRQFVGEPIVRRTLNGGVNWDVPGQPGFMGNLGALRMHIPYISATWNDTIGYLITDDMSNGLINIARSANLKSGTGAVTWAQRGCVLTGGDSLTHGHKWFDVCFDNSDHLALILTPGAAVGGGMYILVYTSDNAGVTWTLWYKSSSTHKLSSAAFFAWNTAQQLESILCHDYLNNKVLLLTSAGVVDKTGDLYSVAPTLDYATMVDRDTMGAA